MELHEELLFYRPGKSISKVCHSGSLRLQMSGWIQLRVTGWPSFAQRDLLWLHVASWKSWRHKNWCPAAVSLESIRVYWCQSAQMLKVP